MDTAAVMRQLDLVITSDSAIAHLAGALGVPVWTAVSRGADWRWLDARDDSPWYPSMRLFRQQKLGDWDEVFQRIAAAVEIEMARGGAAFGTVTSSIARASVGVSPEAAAHAEVGEPSSGAPAASPGVSIVTPWRDHPELIADYERAVQGAQVIIVDNGSQPEAAAELLAMVERLGGVYLRNEHNAGFAAANNQGFAHAEGDIVVFLNNDIAAPPEFLEAVRRDVQAGELVGAQMGCHMLWGLNVPYIIGWCGAARREVFQQLGGWDAAAYVDPLWEDNDLSLRAIEAGINVRQCYWPIHHKGGKSLGGMLLWGDVYERNRATFAARVERVYRRMRAESDKVVSLPSAKRMSFNVPKGAAAAAVGAPLISVVIPCYNGSAYLADCIDSVFAQEMNCEIIVVDDGSTDDSLHVAKELMRQSPFPMRVIAQTNGGPAAARNTGLRFAEGKYVCFLDIDDEYLPGFFAAALARLEAQPSFVAAGCGVQLVNLHRQAETWHANVVADSIPGNLLIRTEAARRLGGFSCHQAFRGKAAGEDIAFRQQLFRLGKIAVIQDPLYRYRVQRGSHFDMLVDRMTNDGGQYGIQWVTPEEADGSLKLAWVEYEESVRAREAARIRRELIVFLAMVGDCRGLPQEFAALEGSLGDAERLALDWLARHWPAEGRLVAVGGSDGQAGDDRLQASEPLRLLFVGNDVADEALTAEVAGLAKSVSPHGLIVIPDGAATKVHRFFEQLAESSQWQAWPPLGNLRVFEKR